ncbi:MAG: M24 family metallopeptidase [Candidatus Hodarchaeales archaeon]
MTRFITNEKLSKLYDHLSDIGIDILYITDSEDHRDVNLKYITGLSEDAILLLDVPNRQSMLIPWDVQLAHDHAEVDQIVNFADFDGLIPATVETFKKNFGSNPKVGIPRAIPYFMVKTILENISDAEIVYNPREIDSFLNKLRSTKSPYEISLLQKSILISNQLTKEIKEIMNDRTEVKTEMDLAIFIESRMRKLGAHGMGFETIVASSSRSWQIHAYPCADPMVGLFEKGLALTDFGVNAAGLTSDVTIPFVMGEMNRKMKTIVETVEQAHDKAIDKLKEAEFVHEVAEVAIEEIESKGFKMPHALGHGIGLTTHDSPVLIKKPVHKNLLKNWEETPLERDMVITIEPGIYERDVGGFRLENDVLMTSNGPKVLTNSHTIFIDC